MELEKLRRPSPFTLWTRGMARAISVGEDRKIVEPGSDDSDEEEGDTSSCPNRLTDSDRSGLSSEAEAV